MKIVSVNGEQTIDGHQVAFNLDTKLSSELLEKLDYGSLSFRGGGNVLIVTLDPGDNDPIGSDTVELINEKLEEAVQAVANDATKRQRLLSVIARHAGLPLA